MAYWKEINGYEKKYKVSSLGDVISLGRYVNGKSNSKRYIKEKVLTPNIVKGYLAVNLSGKTFYIHKLVAIHFLNHEPNGMNQVVDHIDGNKLNNEYTNLRIVSQRENSSLKNRGTSKYVGVCWFSAKRKWKAQAYINGKQKHLGLFDNELDARNAYLAAISNC